MIEYAYVRTEGVLGAVDVEVAVSAVWVVGGVAHQVTAEAVAHPYAQLQGQN